MGFSLSLSLSHTTHTPNPRTHARRARESKRRRAMILAALVMNTQGKPRITKFYVPLGVEKQQEAIRTIYSALSQRPEDSCSFVETEDIFGPDTKLVYKHFATLYFIFIIDSSESELGMLDLIQVFVETLDRCFKNVCELDIVYNFNKVHTILDEIVMGGQVVETNSAEVLKAVQDIWKLERVGDLNVPSVRGIGSYRSKS
ncbi:hypothetical protein CY35_11G066200 [Sphagnum magellanicum]|nr:hypothetical protein CY35_11G066200 [Sphagnum magellanicum]